MSKGRAVFLIAVATFPSGTGFLMDHALLSSVYSS